MPAEIPAGVLYRHENKWPPASEYDEAIEELVCARSQLKPDGRNCAVCGDSGHQAFECHHNPLVVARRWTAATSVWRCYHCGFTATTDAEAKGHFGDTMTGDPTSCLLTKLEAKERIIDQLLAKMNEPANGVAGTLSEQEKELGACSISRAAIGDRTHDRRTQESDRIAGEEKQRGGQAGRCDATRAGGAEPGARGGDAAQHEVTQGPGPSAPVCPACGGNDKDAPCAFPEGGQPGCLRDKRLAHGVDASDGKVSAQQTPIPSPMDYEGEG